MSDEIKTEATTGQAAQPEVRKLSKAQAKRFKDLQVNLARAEASLQDFVSYLAEEHDIPEGEHWQIGPEGFVRAATPANGTP